MKNLETDITPVVFRKYREGDIIALFPFEVGTSDPYTCGSYQHIGQHGAANPQLVYDTLPAQPNEYAALKEELESAPYNYRLQVIKRIPYAALVRRKATLRAMTVSEDMDS